MFHPRNKQLVSFARQLRKEMTKQERRLWYAYLRDCPLRFRRQEIIGPYIADFYCSQAKLVVEVDGSQHFEEQGKRNDQTRSSYFESLGLKVIRISNAEINKNLSGVCEFLDDQIRAATPQSAEADSFPSGGGKGEPL